MKILAFRKPLLISAWLLAMQGTSFAQNPIVQTQLTIEPAKLVARCLINNHAGYDKNEKDLSWQVLCALCSER